MVDPVVRWAPPAVRSLARLAVEVAASVGLILDDWQVLALEDALGVDATGKWVAFEAGVNVARQNGKGGILEARELLGLLELGERLQMHSCHEFQTSMEAMLRMEEYLAASPDVAAKVKSVSRSHGSEGFILKTGQRLRYRTRTKGGGRGFTGDLLVLDEAMVLPDSFVGALLPTLSGRSVTGNPQVFYMGSAVDQEVHEHGVAFARIRERGIKGGDPSLAYDEWAALPPFDGEGEPVRPDNVERAILSDRGAWRRANPGLGVRISEEHVEKELRSMGWRTFAVERLGIGDWPRTDTDDLGVIDWEAWQRLEDIDSTVVSPVVFAFDVKPDRGSASIVACGRRSDDLLHVEVVECKGGTKWVAPRLKALSVAHDPAVIVCDSRGPAASLLQKLEDARVRVETTSSSEFAQACGRLVDAVNDETVRHLGQRELDAAVRGAVTRPLGDAWAWSRRGSNVDISPLVAASLAVWAADRSTESVYKERGVIVV